MFEDMTNFEIIACIISGMATLGALVVALRVHKLCRQAMKRKKNFETIEETMTIILKDLSKK
jgi:hypothetical protein